MTKLREIAESGSKIIDRKRHAQVPEPIDSQRAAIGLAHERSLRHLDLQLAGIDAARPEGGFYKRYKFFTRQV